MAPAPKPLSECMQERNSAYYQSDKTSIYEDFQTYAQSVHGMLTRAEAAEFHSVARAHKKNRRNIMEVGVGEGAFALGFMHELVRLDKVHKADVAGQVHYTLCDFSTPMLEKAYANLSKAGFGHQSDIRAWDATDADALPILSADLIRCNELFSDLPAAAYLRKGDQLQEARFDDELKLHPHQADWQDLDDLERKLLYALPEGYVLPFNRLARDALFALMQNLNPGAKLDVFDYGFYKSDDFSIPADIWNDTLVREYNSQWTVDLNFLYLSVAMAHEGFSAHIQFQEEYVKRFLDNTGVVKQKTKTDADGLDYSDVSDEDVQEDDFFYHMELRKQW